MQLVIQGKPLEITVPADAMNKAGTSLGRLSDYARARGVVIKKDEPGFDKAKAKALRSDFNVIRGQHYGQIRPYGALIAADPNWQLRSFSPSQTGSSVKLVYRKVAADAASAAVIAQLSAELAELKAKLSARDV